MTDSLVVVERSDDGVAVVRLNNGKVNALSQALLTELAAAAADLAADPPGAVVLTGGERIFAAGADIGEFGGPEEAEMIGDGFHTALDAVAAIPGSSSPRSAASPSVAAVSWPWPATTASPAPRRCSASRRCCSASSPAVAAPNGCHG
jgi:enoyl-CoA hydratase/carnithine racemase